MTGVIQVSGVNDGSDSGEAEKTGGALQGPHHVVEKLTWGVNSVRSFFFPVSSAPRLRVDEEPPVTIVRWCRSRSGGHPLCFFRFQVSKRPSMKEISSAELRSVRLAMATSTAGSPAAVAASAYTASPHTKNPQTKHIWVYVSGKSPRDLGIPALNITNLLESDPLRCRFLVRGLAVRLTRGSY